MESDISQKVKLLIQLSNELYYIDVNEAEMSARRAMELAQQIRDLEGVYESKITLGHLEVVNNHFKEAITLLKSALNYFERMEDGDSELKRADIYSGLGKAYCEMSNYIKAHEYLKQSLNIYRKCNEIDKEATLLNNIGMVYKKNDKAAEALAYFSKSNEMIIKHIDSRGCPIILFNIGASLNLLEKYSEAEPILRKSYELSSSQDYLLNKSLCLSEIGVIHKAHRKYEDAIECFKLSNLHLLKTTHRETVIKNHQYMGMIFQKSNKIERAIKYFDDSIQLAANYHHSELAEVSYKHLSEIHEQLGHYKLAYQYHQKFHEIKIENLMRQNEVKIQSLVIDSQIDKLKQQNEIYVIRNIELKKKNNLLKVLSTTDELTGAYNRRHIIEKLGYLTQGIRNNPETVHHLLMIDVDEFKYINDTYGHAVGDYVLKAISQVIREIIGDGGIVARYGGDEFLVIFENARPDYVLETSLLIRQRIALLLCDRGYTVTISGGVAVMDKDHCQVDEILTAADDLLYVAKENNKDQICLA